MSNQIIRHSFEVIETGTVNERVRVTLRYGAHVDVSQNFEIATNSPTGSPRVLDIPKLVTLLNTVSGSQDCVVYVLLRETAILVAVNTTFVILETCDNLERN